MAGTNTPVLITLEPDRKKILLIFFAGLACTALALIYIWFFAPGRVESFLIFITPSFFTAGHFSLNLLFFLNPYKISVHESGLYIQHIGFIKWDKVQSVSLEKKPNTPAQRHSIMPDRLFIDLYNEPSIRGNFKSHTGVECEFIDEITVRLKFGVVTTNCNPEKFEKICTDMIFKNLPKFKES